MPQNEYWEKRFTLLNEMLLQKSDDYIKHAQLSYAAVMASIEKDINDFYMRFAQENNITFQETKQLLTSEQRQQFQMELKDYIAQGQQANLSPEWLHILENASTVHRITRLQAIQFQLRQQVELLEAKKVSEITSLLKNIFQENYYRTAYEIQRGTGVGSAFSKISTKHIEKVLAKPWAPDGKNFSERIWGQDRTNLVYQLETRFTQGVIRGDAPQRIIADMKKSLNSSQYATKRLVLTESAFISATSRKESLKMLGVEEYKVIATLEINTCEVCRALDGKVFLLKDFKIGTNAHPFHPGCRCDEVPKIDEKYTKNHQRAARGKDGKTYYVPVDMTYPEWYKTYVESDPDWLLQEKKLKNKSADKKQYEEYKSIFGKKEVGSFDDFQNTKYTNIEEWNNLKQKRRDSLKNTSANNKSTSFVPAKTIEEANDYAMHVLGIQMASYKGVDITTANEWNRGLKDTFDRFPALKQNFGFVGECHERNRILEATMKKEFLNISSTNNPNVDKKDLKELVNEKVKFFMKKIRVREDDYAQSFSASPKTFIYDFRGVTVNKKFGKNSIDFIKELKENVKSKYHPICCDTIRYVLDHEVGHQLDIMLGISQQKNIQKLFHSMSNETITDELAEYAWDNENSNLYAEFVAEGWAEYCNNPKPRKVAKEIGQTIERRYAEWIKQNS